MFTSLEVFIRLIPQFIRARIGLLVVITLTLNQILQGEGGSLTMKFIVGNYLLTLFLSGTIRRCIELQA